MGLKSLSLRKRKTTSLRKGAGLDVSIDTTPFPISDPWYRNPSWLTLPTVTATDDKFVGLMGVYDTAENNVVMRVTTSGGTGNTVEIDWGDGTVVETTSNVNIEHTYDYNDVNLANTDAPVTFGSDTVTRSNHGYVDGNRVSFYITSISDVEQHVRYHVVNATTNTFQLALTEGGTPITIGTGTGSILPYKQAIVTVVPINGAVITTIDLQQQHSRLTQRRDRNWLDVAFSLPSCTSRVNFGNEAGAPYLPYSIEKVNVVNYGSLTNLSSAFRGMRTLEDISIDFRGNDCSHISLIFYQCNRLAHVPDFDAIYTGTNVNQAFQGCYSLRSIPTFNSIASSISYFSSFCNSCRLIKLFPEQYQNARDAYGTLLDASNICNSAYNLITYPHITHLNSTNSFRLANGFSGAYKPKKARYIRYNDGYAPTLMYGIYASNHSLTTVQSLSMPLCTNISSVHNTNPCLKAQTIENNTAATSLGSTFQYCESLKTLRGELNLPNATSFASMFSYTRALSSIPQITSSSALTNMYAMFRDTALQNIPLFDATGVTDARYLIYGSRRVEEVPNYVFSSGINLLQAAQAAHSLKKWNPDLTNANNVQYLFNQAYLLEYIGDTNTVNLPNVTGSNALGFLQNASMIRYIDFTANNITNIQNFAYNSRSLRRIKITATSATAAANAFTGQAYGGWGSVELIEADLPAMGANQTMFAYSTSLKLARLNIPNSFPLATLDMSGGMLDYLYTHLPTVSGKTINITNNRGRTEDDPSIATAKGWTVTG